MASKLWEKTVQVDHNVEKYTVGRDREMDMYLAPFDVIGSMAHITMLQSIGLLTADELAQLLTELRHIYKEIKQGRFEIEEGVEDIHSQVELLLTRKLGDLGKKIHSGRSRNDQVLVDLRLFIRSKIEAVVEAMTRLFKTLQAQSERYKGILMPGYTHLHATEEFCGISVIDALKADKQAVLMRSPGPHCKRPCAAIGKFQKYLAIEVGRVLGIPVHADFAAHSMGPCNLAKTDVFCHLFGNLQGHMSSRFV